MSVHIIYAPSTSIWFPKYKFQALISVELGLGFWSKMVL